MAAETFINVGETALSVAATNVATTFTLSSGAPFNVTGQFRLRLDDSLQQGSGIATRYEICRATFSAGNVVNAFRSGVDLEGTTAQAWPIGTKVVAIVTAAALANITTGPYRARAYNSVLLGGVTSATKITLGAKSYDPNTNFDTANSRYVCPVSGYYDCRWRLESDRGGIVVTALYLNGSPVSYGSEGAVTTVNDTVSVGTDIIYATAGQYFEMFCSFASVAFNTMTGASTTWLTVALSSSA